MAFDTGTAIKPGGGSVGLFVCPCPNGRSGVVFPAICWLGRLLLPSDPVEGAPSDAPSCDHLP